MSIFALICIDPLSVDTKRATKTVPFLKKMFYFSYEES